MLPNILNQTLPLAQRAIAMVRTAIARWSKPIAHTPSVHVVTDLARSKPQLVAENLLLRQQLIVLQRSVKRPRFTPAERGLFVLLASKLQSWKEALLIVKPETVLRCIDWGFVCSGRRNHTRPPVHRKSRWRRSP